MWDVVLTEAVSTNDLAKEAALAGAPDGAWISARRQTGGRGRLGRAWQSIEGNLFISLISRSCPRELWSWIPLASGLGAARAIASVAGVETRLKWPNDLKIGEAKVGGILCEAAGDFVVVGLGINCAAAPEGLDQRVTSLSAECGRRITAEHLREPLVVELRAVLDELAARGSRAVSEAYLKLAAFRPGEAVEWGPGTRGTLEGLGDHGELLVRVDGKIERLYAEDVTGARRASGESPA